MEQYGMNLEEAIRTIHEFVVPDNRDEDVLRALRLVVSAARNQTDGVVPRTFTVEAEFGFQDDDSDEDAETIVRVTAGNSATSFGGEVELESVWTAGDQVKARFAVKDYRSVAAEKAIDVFCSNLEFHADVWYVGCEIVPDVTVAQAKAAVSTLGELIGMPVGPDKFDQAQETLWRFLDQADRVAPTITSSDAQPPVVRSITCDGEYAVLVNGQMVFGLNDENELLVSEDVSTARLSDLLGVSASAPADVSLDALPADWNWDDVQFMERIRLTATAKFPDQLIEVAYQTDEDETGGWCLFVGPGREHCYAIEEAAGGFCFDQRD